MTAIEEAHKGSLIRRWFRGNSDNLLQRLHGAMLFTESDEVEDELDFLYEFEVTRREMALEAKHV